MAATTFIGTAFLFATVASLLQKLTSSQFIDYVKSSKLNLLKLTSLEAKLLTLHSVLHDAEQKQFFNPKIKQWMNDLYNSITVTEDLIDEIGYDLLKCKVENIQPKFDFDFNFRLKMICLKLQPFVQQIDVIGLRSVSGGVCCRIGSSLVVNESVIVGRNDDKERLMNMLLLDNGAINKNNDDNDNNNDNNLGVIAVLGVGGVGKSTLARIVYDDEEVKEYFDLKVWVCVSEDFDIVRVTKTLVEFVTSNKYAIDDLDFLRAELMIGLRCKRFLIVLDGLGNWSYSDWHEMVTPLINGKFGSRVIITTRFEEVAEFAHTFPIHKLEPLSEEDCWSLLSNYVFGSGGNEFPNLEAIGRNIARKCGGLPIAAKTLGGILSSKVDENEWNEIMNSNMWNLPNENDNILPALLLSYQYLPSYLKSCFAYCSIFPKGYHLDRKELVLLWMAEGFLEHSVVEKAREEVGDDYFIELLSRSLIEKLNDDTGTEKFVMHCLVHDLATNVSGKSCCRLESGDRISKYVHHFSHYQEEYDNFKKFDILYDIKSLRSFLTIDVWWRFNYLSSKVVDDLLPTLISLRTLSLSHYSNITMLPNSIGNLLHLRYLNFSNTRIKCLPDTICDLYYLQTLNLSGCTNLFKLPAHVRKLINLRHLDISRTKIKKMPMQIIELENLKTLTVFVVGKQKVGLSVKELGKFPNLGGKLCIRNLHNVTDVSEVCDANLKCKKYIEELELYWNKQTKDSSTEKIILDELQPSINLKKLSLGFYGGTSFPNWLGDCSFSNMVYLCINSCEYCITLPPLGQLPSLKELLIKDMSRVETIGPEFYGMTGGNTNSLFQPFPSLEKLQFVSMSSWKEWLSFGGNKFPFPRLKTLLLSECTELRGHLPSHLSSIEKITIHGCDRLLATSSTLHMLSSVKSLYLISEGSNELSLLVSDSTCLVKHASIFGFNPLLSLPKMFLSSSCLQHLKLIYVSSLTAFPPNGLPTSLQSLCIGECKNLAFLPPGTWSSYTSLVTLELRNCCETLTSFQLNGFPMLQSLSIEGCSSLESIFILENSSLGPSTLQSLQVRNCDALRSLPQQMNTLIALKSLTLDGLYSCWEGALDSLMHTESMRRTTPVTEWGLQNLNALSHLHIGGDNIVNTLLKDNLLPNFLVSLTITNLSETKCFEGNGLQHMSIKNLTFKCCSSLESFSEDMLPSFLKSLVFVNCPKLKSFPERLPSNLESLEFDECQRLVFLPRFRVPSSLKLLSISQCHLLRAWYVIRRRLHESMVSRIPVIKVNDEVNI